MGERFRVSEGSTYSDDDTLTVTLDWAILEARRLSEKRRTQHWVTDYEIPKRPRIRGWAIGGRWAYVDPCKQCKGVGSVVNPWDSYSTLTCPECKGASYLEVYP